MALVDLTIKDKSTKISWITVLHKEQKMSNIVYENISPNLKELIWSCSIKKEDIKHVCDSPFWRQVLEAWFELKELSDDSKRNAPEILWFNSKIRIENKPFCWKPSFEKGLVYIHQLCENECFISVKEAYNRYGLDVMSYNSLLSAMSYELKKQAKQYKVRSSNNLTFYDTVKTMDKLSSHAYKAFTNAIEDSSVKKKAKDWEIDLELQELDLVKTFRELYMVTNMPKYRAFQYRLLHRAITLNSHLFRWKMRQDNLCTFCGKDKETYVHLFIMCEKVRDLWINLECFMYKLNDEDIVFNQKNVILNKLVSNTSNVKNLCCLICKQYIYKAEMLWKRIQTSMN